MPLFLPFQSFSFARGGKTEENGHDTTNNRNTNNRNRNRNNSKQKKRRSTNKEQREKRADRSNNDEQEHFHPSHRMSKTTPLAAVKGKKQRLQRMGEAWKSIFPVGAAWKMEQVHRGPCPGTAWNFGHLRGCVDELLSGMRAKMLIFSRAQSPISW